MKPLSHLLHVHARFNRGAPRYAARAAVQIEAARRLIAEIGEIPEPLRILEAGCGSGQLTRMLVDRFVHSRVTAFDLSEVMLSEARAALAGAGRRVRWMQADFAHIETPLSFPLVISSSSLHWAVPLEAAMARLARSVAPDGLFAVSMMLDGTFAELRESLARIAPAKAPPGRLPDLARLETASAAAGLTMLRSGSYDIIARHPSAAAFLSCIHEQGLTGGTLFRPHPALNPSEVRRLATDYEHAHADPAGGVRATYRIGWLLAHPKAAAPGRTGRKG